LSPCPSLVILPGEEARSIDVDDNHLEAIDEL
jgi:hypothetical protein